MNAVFHWINDKEKALNNIHRALKPGGKLGICTGDKDHPFTVKIIATPNYLMETILLSVMVSIMIKLHTMVFSTIIKATTPSTKHPT
jgi:ubiquinone/menaquinone biosynthesis C-methylase UbiE